MPSSIIIYCAFCPDGSLHFASDSEGHLVSKLEALDTPANRVVCRPHRSVRIEIEDDVDYLLGEGWTSPSVSAKLATYPNWLAPQFSCRTCGERVVGDDMRPHLEQHHSGASAFDTNQVRDCFEAVD